jgi:hypothetical protein
MPLGDASCLSEVAPEVSSRIPCLRAAVRQLEVMQQLGGIWLQLSLCMGSCTVRLQVLDCRISHLKECHGDWLS